MLENNFIWADLSTFDVQTAQNFYSKVFDWKYKEVDQGYLTSAIRGKETSGLYLTPEKFRKMNMPSFWMSYIQVENVDETVQKARAMGGIIEFVDHSLNIGSIALIRDPSGAGFTVYEGNYLDARTLEEAGTFVWNELFVSDAQLVIKFYETIFDWKVVPSSNNRYLIYNSNGENISAIQQLSNEVKGKHEYWAVYFAVDDIEQTKSRVLENEGKVISEDEFSVLFSDPFDAIFQIVSRNWA